jgi:flavin-dependent dehydrogenase
MAEYRWDLAVVGGGLAGSAVATLLAHQGWTVGLLEQGDFQKPRVGEVVAYPMVKWLRDLLGLDLFEFPDIMRSPVHFRVMWGLDSPVPPDLQNRTDTHIRIDRLALDRCLWEHAARVGACGLTNAQIRAWHQSSHGWEIEFERNKMMHKANCRFVIEATGRTRFSPLTTDRRRLYEDASIACAIRVSMHGAQRLNQQVWIESHEQGWWYVSELPASECLIVFFTDRDLLARRSEPRNAWICQQWTRTRACTEVFDGMELNELPHSQWTRHDARMSLRRKCFGKGWMAIGDAQIALDPLSGQGIMETLRSALSASEFLSSQTDIQRLDWGNWARTIADRYHHHRLKRIEQYARETRYSDFAYWNRREASTNSTILQDQTL